MYISYGNPFCHSEVFFVYHRNHFCVIGIIFVILEIILELPFVQNLIMFHHIQIKCKNFLATLLRLASDQPESVARNVRGLIQVRNVRG